jgi:hypothetical protein
MWPERGDPQPWPVKKWVLIDRLGWTPDQVDDLAAEDYFEGMAVLGALDSVRAAKSKPPDS